jgi:tight adherence protein B
MTPAEPLDLVADSAERLAVLLGAGLPAAVAWRQLAATQPDDATLALAADAAQEGRSIAGSLRSAKHVNSGTAAWSAVCCGIEISERTGAPLVPVLTGLSGALREQAQARRDVETALTGPRLSARLVLALPVVGMGFAFLLGANPLVALLSSPAGLVCLTTGLALLLCGALWSRRLVRRAEPPPGLVGLEEDLVAMAVTAGAPVGHALDLVGSVLARPEDRAGSPAIEAAVRLATGAGVPVAGLLSGEARLQRRRAATEARRRAEALAVLLLIPLGACILPSFLLLGVAPLLLSLVSSTVL